MRTQAELKNKIYELTKDMGKGKANILAAIYTLNWVLEERREIFEDGD